MSLLKRLAQWVPRGACGFFLFFLVAAGPVRADEVRLHYDRSGNVVAVQEAAATALAIEDVRPGFGAVGDVVTVVGSGFSTTTGSNTVTFSNGVAATVISAATNALTVRVPASAISGPVNVQVSTANAQSPGNFVVLPSGMSSASVSNATGITLDGSALDVATVGSRSVAVPFAMTQGKYASIQFTAFSGSNTSSAYYIYKPDGSLLVSGNVGPTAPTILLPPIPVAGIYTLYLKPQGWLKTTMALISDPNWVVDGSGLTLASALPYQQQRAWFSATAAQNLSYGYTNLTVAPTTASGPQITFYKPDGTVLNSLIGLPVTASYSVVITPAAAATSTNLQLWLNPEITGTLPLNTANALSVTRPGQHARLTFQGTQGQYLRLAANTTSTANPANQRVGLSIYSPNGSLFVDTDVATSSGSQAYSVPALPSTGTYTLFVGIDTYGDNQNATWATTVSLSADVAATITVDGPVTNVSTIAQGQEIIATFSATAGQNLGFALTNLSLTPSTASYPQIAVYEPDGTRLTSWSNLPQSGTYLVVITTAADTTAASMQLWLSSELTGTLSLDTPTPLSVSRPGQRARYTFQATQGQYLRLAANSTGTNPVNQRVVMSIYNPNGSILVDSDVATSSGSQAYYVPPLPSTGTYTLLVGINVYDNQNSTWATTVTLSSDVAATIAIDGTATSVSTTNQGQEVRATFTGTAGQNLAFALTNLSLTPASAGYPQVVVYKPDGSTLTSWTNLPQSGTYTVVVTTSAYTTSSSMLLWLSSDLTGTLAPNTATPLSVSRPGQHARYTFQGTQGHVVNFTAASTSTNPPGQRVSIYVYNPDGTVLVDGLSFIATSSGTQTYASPAAPATGTYTVFLEIDPYDNGTATWATTLTVAP